MHKQRVKQLWRLMATLFGLSLFALGSFWLVQVSNRTDLDMKLDAQSDQPDYIVDSFSFVRMSKAGQPSYLISGTRLTHRPKDDSSDIDLPVVRSLSNPQSPMNMRSERAHVDMGNTRLHMMDDVRIDRPAGPGVQKMTMKTQALTIFSDEDRMETDQAVEMMLGTSTLSGTGMKANNATRQLDLAQKVKIFYPPAPH